MTAPNQNRSLEVYSNPNDLLKYLEKAKGKIAMALPKHLNPDRMLRLALTAFSTVRGLNECTGMSILSSIVVASQIGLEPGVAGQGYLIPYGKNCTFVPGWQGLVGLLNNSGRATAWTGCVFEGDEWDFQLGSQPVCRHVPGENFGDPEAMKWVYACGKVNGSEQPVIEAWPMTRVWRHRDRFNKVGAKHYSFQHPEMYARKVVLLQVLKYMPRSVELQNALVAANSADSSRVAEVVDGVVIDTGVEIMDAGGAMQFEAPKQVADAKQSDDARSRVAALMERDGIDTDALRFFLRRNEEGDFKTWDEIPDKTLAGIEQSWETIRNQLK
jgi:recombination protein RecT